MRWRGCPLGAHQKAFARADTVATLYANNASRHPGDLYGTRALRSPIGMDAGDNLVVVRALGRGATPEIELFSTTSEVVWNPGDVTRPELVVGSSEEQWLGIATLVLVPHALSSVTAEVLEGDNLEGTQVDYPLSLPARRHPVELPAAPQGTLEQRGSHGAGEAAPHLPRPRLAL
jgi:hypothetical protein